MVSFSFLTPLPCRVSLWIWSFHSKAFQVVQCDAWHWVISVFASRNIRVFQYVVFVVFALQIFFFYVLLCMWRVGRIRFLPCFLVPWIIWVRVCWFSDKSCHKHFCSSSSPSKAADDCRHLLPFHVNNLFLIRRSRVLFADSWGHERFLRELVGIISSYMVKDNAPTHTNIHLFYLVFRCVFLS